MHKSGLNYYDLLQAAGIRPENLSAWIDGYFADKYNTAMWDGFSFDLFPMMDYSYQQFQAELKVNVMATYINPDSKIKARSTEGFEKLSGTIPTLAARLERDEKEVRDLMNAQKEQPNKAVKQAIALLYRKIDDLLSSHVNSITYQINQMKSLGKLELLNTNNPGGIENVTFSAQIPASNTTAKDSTNAWWTSAAHTSEGSTSDPIKDMKAEIRKLRNVGVTNVVAEVEYLTFQDILSHSKVLTAIGYNTYIGAAGDAAALNIGTTLGDDARKLALERIIGCPILVTDHLASVETFDKKKMAIVKTQLNSFAKDVVIFRPAGDLGVIKHVTPILPPPGGNVALAQYFNGSLLLKVHTDTDNNIQRFDTKQAVLAVIDKPKYIYRLVVV
jgi:hypothetical protein